MLIPDSPGTFRFGDFELDVGAYALRRNGRPVRIERQPMDLLLLLVERRGQLVLRSEIVDRLWGEDVFVDVETGVHTAIRKVRQALRDSPDAPTFVETVSGKGYRFIATVEVFGAPRAAAGLAKAQPAAAATASDAAAAGPPRVAGSALSVGGAPIEIAMAAGLTRPGDDGDPNASAAAAATAHPAIEVEPPAPPREGFQVRRSLGFGLVALGLLVGVLNWERSPRDAGPRASPLMLAVLPFTNLSGDPAREYLAEGLAEETTTSLGQIDPEQMGVVARSSTMRYKGTTKSAAEIGRELAADYLVESSLRTEDNRLRVTSTLVRVRDQVQMWSQSYDREPMSLLGLQRELSTAIAEQIRLRLSPGRLETLARRQTQSPDAYDLYLRGRNFENQRTPVTNLRAIEYYTRATELDPAYALAWSSIARVLASSLLNGDASPSEVLPRAREAAARAVGTGRATAEVQFALAYLKWCCEWEWPAAEASFRLALTLDPRAAQAHLTLGHVLSQMGRHGEALLSTRRACELDPLSARMPALSSQVAFQARDYRAALDYARQAIVLDPEFWIGHMMRGQALEQLGEHESALELDDSGTVLRSEQQTPVAQGLHPGETRADRRGARDAAHTRIGLTGELCAPVRDGADQRRPGRAGVGLYLARTRLRRAGHPPDLSDRGPEMGFVSRRSPLRSAHRAVWLQANREPNPVAVGRTNARSRVSLSKSELSLDIADIDALVTSYERGALTRR
jgi:TolB-like protein/DNA-binding winged helix-turn-helix (wHTH) protein